MSPPTAPVPLDPAIKTASNGFGSKLVLFVAFALVAVGVFGQFLFGDKLLLFTDIGSDTFYNYYANYYLLASYIADLQLPLWSFKLGAGSSMLTLYQFLYDPFSIVYYVVGADNISRAIAWVFALKALCAALFTYAYLRQLGVGSHARVVGSLLFAFNGFLMGFGQHYFYATWVVFLPLMLWAIERWLRADKWLPLALCAGYMALNIAICWQVAIFCILYVLARVGLDWNTRPAREWCRKLTSTGVVVALGIGLSAVLWLPEYHILSASPRIAGSFLQSLSQTATGFFRLFGPDYYWSLLSRIFSNNLQGIGSGYVGFLNYYESMQLYVGVLPLLLLPQVFHGRSTREKWIALLAVLAAVLFLATPGFSQLMNGFQYAHQRWGYNIIMFEVLVAAIVLDRLVRGRSLNLPVLGLTGLVLLACLAALHVHGEALAPELQAYSERRLLQSLGFIVLYIGLLAWLARGRHGQLAFFLLVASVAGEMVLEHRDSFSLRSTLDKGIEDKRSVHYFDYGNQVVKRLNARDPGFYRIEKNHWILSLNDSLIQDYHGLDTYQSLNSPAYIEFLKAMGYTFRNLNVVVWNSLEHPYLADLLSVKYHLTKSAKVVPQDARFMEQVGDVMVYERTGYLPFGFTYDAQVPLSAFIPLDAAGRARALLQGALLLDQPAPIELKQVSRIAAAGDEVELKRGLKQEVMRVDRMEDDAIDGSIRLDSPKLLFLSIPFDPGWSARVDGKRQSLHRVNVGFSGLYLGAGEHRIQLAYRPPLMMLGAAISALALAGILGLLAYSRRRVPDPRNLERQSP